MMKHAKTVTDLGNSVASLQFQAATDIMDALSQHPYLQQSFLALWRCVVRDTERLDNQDSLVDDLCKDIEWMWNEIDRLRELNNNQARIINLSSDSNIW